ncbi:MAG: terminase family protein [Pseudolabrys sp.]
MRSFRAETLDYVWLDEEPPIDIYTEALTRTNVGASPVWLTFTPLQGVSTVVKRFLHEKSEDRHNVVMTLDDVEHYSNDEKKKIIASYPPHEAEARIKGIPVLGSGRYFPSRRKPLPSTIVNFRVALAADRRHGLRLGSTT